MMSIVSNNGITSAARIFHNRFVAVTLIFLLLLAGLAPYEQSGITIYLIGDSTMSDKEVRAYPETGWGTPFAHYFNSHVTVENHARNGRSSRTFWEEGRWKPIVDNLKEGDYVFIQFGHNDEVSSKPQSTTEAEFQEYLTKYVRETRARHAQPVLLTSIARRAFDSEGNLEDTHRIYSQLMREVAWSEDVPLIDMDRKSRLLLEEMGPEKSKFLFNHLEPGQNPNYPEGRIDNTHFNELGGRRMAELVLEGIRELKLGLADHVVMR